MRDKRVSIVALALLAAAPVALAQPKGAPAPKGGKPDAKSAAPATPDPPKKADPEPPKPAASAAEPKPEPKEEPKTDKAEAKSDAASTAADKGTEEVSGRKYYYLGARYRGTVIPQFLVNLFVDEGRTVVSHSVGVELDTRKDGFSLIPALSYTEFGTDDIIFKQKSKDGNDPGNWSVVNSSLKGIFLSADLLWSTNVSPYVDIEYGAGFGLGVLFGNLENNWVRFDDKGSLKGGGHTFSRCATENDGLGCAKKNHDNADVAKVGGYIEPKWTSGGSTPNVFPYIGVPHLGVRIKPTHDFALRVGFGFSLTGFFFGISGGYLVGTSDRKPLSSKTSGPAQASALPRSVEPPHRFGSEF